MRSLLPPSDDVDVVEAYAAARPAPVGRPWVLADMIATADGAATVDGRSGGLGGTGDRAVFRAVRAVADVVLVGAGTVRAERYGPATATPELAERRAARGQAPAPRIAVVTASAELDPDLPLFGDPARPPLVLTTASADAGRRSALAEVAEVVEVTDAPRLRPADALRALHDRGAAVVLCEGGPSLLGQVVADDLLDELCLSVAPTLAAGGAPRIAVADQAVAAPMALAHVLEDEGYLFLRYVRPAGA